MTETKKIALFIPSLRGGGAERVMVNLALEFKRKGHNVTLLIAEDSGSDIKLPDELEKSDVNFGVSRVAKSVFPLMRYLREERPDVLFTTLEQCNFAGIIAKRLTWSRAKVVIRVANTLSVSLKGSKPFRRSVRWFGAATLYWMADEIVVNSEGSARDLSKTAWLARKRISVIDNPVVRDDIFKLAKEPVGHPWLKDKDVPVILSVGRFHKQKDYYTLIKAFAYRRKKEPVKLIILGEGEERSGLEFLVRDNGVAESVSLPGFVENPYAYMSRADIFVLSSLWEGQPNVLIEALALGLPVVATDCPSGPREILQDGKYGELVPVNDQKALAEAIAKVLKDPLDTKEASEYARKRFSVEVSAKEYLKLIE